MGREGGTLPSALPPGPLGWPQAVSMGPCWITVSPWSSPGLGVRGQRPGRGTEGKECTRGRPTFHFCTQTSRSADTFPARRPALKGVRGQLPEGSLRASYPDQRSYVRFHEALRPRVTVWGSGRGARAAQTGSWPLCVCRPPHTWGFHYLRRGEGSPDLGGW